MAVEVERLIASLEARTSQFEKSMNRALGIANKNAAGIQKSFETANKNMSSSFGALGLAASAGLRKVAGVAAAGIGLGAITEEIKRLADVADASNKIGITAEELQALQFAASQAGGSAEEMTKAMEKFNLEVGQSGDKSSQLAKLFEMNGIAMRDAKGELLPLTTQYENFVRLVDGARTPSEAAAIATIGMGKAGAGLVPVLKSMAGGLAEVQKKAQDAGVIVKNDLVARADEFDDAWNAAILSVKAGIASLILEVSKARPFETLQSNWAQDLAKRSAADIQRSALGNVEGMSEAQIKERLRAIDSIAARLEQGKTTPDLAGFDTLRNRQPVTKIPPQGGGGGSTETAYQRETDAVNKKIEALKAEALTVNASRLEQEKAKITVDLLAAAKEANAKAGMGENVVTAQQKEQIAALSQTYAEAKIKVEDLEKARTRLIEQADAVRSSLGSATGGFLNDLADGVTAVEALKNAFTSLRTAILNALGNQFIAMLLGPQGTLFGGLFSGGMRAGGGSVQPGRSFQVGERGPETFVPTSPGQIIPAGRTGGGGITISTTIDARGADPSAIPRLQMAVASQHRQIQVILGSQTAQRRGTSLR